MKITFLGATKMVTGSNFLVEGAGKKFLVDCGMYQVSLFATQPFFDDCVAFFVAKARKAIGGPDE